MWDQVWVPRLHLPGCCRYHQRCCVMDFVACEPAGLCWLVCVLGGLQAPPQQDPVSSAPELPVLLLLLLRQGPWQGGLRRVAGLPVRMRAGG